MSGERKQYPAIDLVKFLCALLILLYHYFSEHGPLPGILDEVLSLYAVAVALFMTMSGFLYFEKLKLQSADAKRWFVTKRQVLHIFKVYLLWSIPYLVYTICNWEFSTLTADYVLRQMQQWVFSSTFYTIWFMPSCAIGILLVFFVDQCLPKWFAPVLAVCAYVVGSLMLTYSFTLQSSPMWQGFTAFAVKWLWGPRGGIFFGFPLIYLGGMISRCREKPLFFLSGFGSIVAMGFLLLEALLIRNLAHTHTGIDMAIMMPFVCVTVLLFMVELPLKRRGAFLWMRKMSLLVFMSQRLFLTVIPHYLAKEVREFISRNTYAWALIVCSCTILFSVFIIAISKRYKIFKNLY